MNDNVSKERGLIALALSFTRIAVGAGLCCETNGSAAPLIYQARLFVK
jgi:hypothetical protein